MRRKKSLPDFIDEKKFLSSWSGHKSGQIVTYKRISDECVSLGTIKWFEVSKEKKVIVTLVDTLLENFQSCYFEDIIEKPDPKVAKKLRKKRDKVVSG